MTRIQTVPSRKVLSEAEALNRDLGHENLGFLSEAYGLAPARPPLLALPATHRPWDELVERLPELYRAQTLRSAVAALPVISAEAANLPEEYLCRASALLSMLAHAYYRVKPVPPEGLPACILQPWEEVTRRLNRPQPFLSYIDLIVYNWKLRDPALPDPMRVENLDLLIPTVGNEEERIFHLTQVETLAQCAAAVGAVVRAQEAIVREDVPALKRELLAILERWQHAGEVSFQKIDPNPRSKTFVDPVVWAKTVAPFAVPIEEGVQGPSGTSSPIFHLMDVFLGRVHYKSVLGTEAMHLRSWYPRHWVDFLAAVGQISLRDFVARGADRSLQGIFQALLDGYASDKGFLGIHRLKVYGYLDIAFKVGRGVTIGGFKGVFQDRTWDVIDNELQNTRGERYEGLVRYWASGRVERGDGSDVPEETGSRWARQIVFDVAYTGVQYRPGDRCGVLAENSPDLIDRTLRALRASGEEPIRLDQRWREAVRARPGHEATAVLPLATLLRYGKIRPVLREVGRTLAVLTASSRLKQILNARREDQWELWDLLELLHEGGFDTRRLWKAEPWEQESICRLVPPEDFRLYSISSAAESDALDGPRGLHLTVGQLEYETQECATSRAGRRFGTASNHLHRLAAEASERRAQVPLQVVPATRFHLPRDQTRPIVMFAAGAGISPFLGFLRERTKQADAGEHWLFFGMRTPEHFLYRAKLERLVGEGLLQLRIAFSASDLVARYVRAETGGRFVFEPGERGRLDRLMEKEDNARALWDLLRGRDEGGQGAHFYVCGQTGFAVSIMQSLLAIIRRFAEGTDEAAREEQARELLYRVVAEGRYLQDIFTTYSGAYGENGQAYNASDVVLHNNGDQGYWFVVNGKVYDVSDFMYLHPGGHRIIVGYAGMDATAAYRAVMHHLNTEVDAMLGMYEIGYIRRLDFRAAWGVAVGPKGLSYVAVEDAFRAWVRFLYLLVEMENALTNDFGFLRRAVTRGEDPEELTPYKIHLTAETHRRFLINYFDPILGDDLQRLWAISVGLCAPGEDVRRLRRELDRVTASADTGLVRACAGIMTELNERLQESDGNDAAALDQLRALGDLIYREDRRFLAETKQALREGVRAFEEHEGNTPARAGGRLLESLLQVAAVAHGFVGRMAAEMRELGIGPPAADAQAAAEAEPRRVEFPGHGVVVEREDPRVACPHLAERGEFAGQTSPRDGRPVGPVAGMAAAAGGASQGVAVAATTGSPGLPTSPDSFAQASWDDIAPHYGELARRPLEPDDRGGVESWLRNWSTLEELLSEAMTVASIGYTSDTRDPVKEAAHLRLSREIGLRMRQERVRLMQRLVELGDRGYALDGLATLLREFRTEIQLFRAANVPLLGELQQLNARYQKITGSLTIRWEDQERPLPFLRPLALSPDRALRERAFRVTAEAQLARHDELAALFDRQLALRGEVARNAGFANYRDYAFRERSRFDYTAADCERFHAAIEETVVPAVARCYERRRRQMGLDRLRPWDTGVDPEGRPPLRPFDDVPTWIARTTTVVERIDPTLGSYFRTMADERLLDLASRPGKAPGSYCTMLPHRGRPFIFMNAVGVGTDAQTLLHEAGHAFHGFEARVQPLVWQRYTSQEFAEVASLAMELLALPYLAREEGGYYSPQDARRAEADILQNTLLIFPQVASVDAFQYWLYTEKTGRTADDRDARDAAWLRLLERFERGIDWNGLEAERTARWYYQPHIFLMPFYSIEYAIAQLGALQVWRNALRDPAGALASYRRALALGGTRPLPELFEAAGARFAFDAATLRELVGLVEERLDALQ